MKTDFLIIGQGLAGTMLAWNLANAGARVVVVDSGNPAAASKVSAGIINPLTGRLFALSWQFETLFEEACRQYGAMEQELQQSVFEKTTVSRAVLQTKGLNDLMMRLEIPEVARWVKSMDSLAPWPELLNPAAHYVHIHGARLQTVKLLQLMKDWLLLKNAFIQDDFQFAELKYEAESYQWKNIAAKHLIWCGGVNPPDQELENWPVIPLKGQVLRIKIPGFAGTGIVKHQIFLAHESEGLFWAGATHEPKNCHPEKDKEGYHYLKTRLDEMIKLPWSCESHESALRPTVKDRRPVLGWYKAAKIPFFVFTGLGTKGASLAPYCAKVLTDHLLNATPLPATLDVNRILK